MHACEQEERILTAAAAAETCATDGQPATQLPVLIITCCALKHS
ncbi:hypothetical protein KUCAC02_027306 [Chaenocephalus aceratus]|uniref:Uncharacterized protein n=1 Tax=Chaenocephalus aceratus TaxID=36190 RepID=A0ACB9W3Z4_CHAAC|nr:hypothetical protein KUCAC02_027306 [Chaenocephalus aceratus]